MHGLKFDISKNFWGSPSPLDVILSTSPLVRASHPRFGFRPSQRHTLFVIFKKIKKNSYYFQTLHGYIRHCGTPSFRFQPTRAKLIDRLR